MLERFSFAVVKWRLYVTFFIALMQREIGDIPEQIKIKRLRAGDDPCPEIVRLGSVVIVIGLYVLVSPLADFGYDAALVPVVGAVILLAFQDVFTSLTRNIRTRNVARQPGVRLS